MNKEQIKWAVKSAFEWPYIITTLIVIFGTAWLIGYNVIFK